MNSEVDGIDEVQIRYEITLKMCACVLQLSLNTVVNVLNWPEDLFCLNPISLRNDRENYQVFSKQEIYSKFDLS